MDQFLVVEIGSFQTACRKTMSKDGCGKIAAMHNTLNVAVNSMNSTLYLVHIGRERQ